jgi:OOP family OmpA-OmpF porin
MQAMKAWKAAWRAGAWAVLCIAGAQAQPSGRAAAQVEVGVETGAQVTAGGQVPDEATRQAVIAALRQIYGDNNVIDKIEVVSGLGVPANWSANILKLLTPELKQTHRGQLQIEGTQVAIFGDVDSDAARQEIIGNMAAALNPTYTVRNSLRVPAVEQNDMDTALAGRIIGFEMGSATLTLKGRQILDEMLPSFRKLQDQKVAIIGHTDDSGVRALNLTLSQARAEAVKGYLVNKGIDPAILTTSGVGPDQPVAPNDSAEGRARNRRIEFRVGKS